MSPETAAFLRDFVYKRSANVVEPGKEYLLEGRLGPVAKDAGLAGLDALAAALRVKADGPLHEKVVEALTTNETSFFRDVHPFETLRTEILPKILETRTASRTLRIWCAAASTGQEPYSIAMTLLEHFPALATWNVSVLATDINATVLERARQGLFKQLEVGRGLPAPLLVKYFDREGNDWRIKPSIRKMVSFQQLNLLDRWPLFSPQDVVFMRNVLIYFDGPTKKGILERVRQHLRPDGCLLLGGAETTTNVDEGFEAVRASKSVYFKLRAATTAAPRRIDVAAG